MEDELLLDGGARAALADTRLAAEETPRLLEMESYRLAHEVSCLMVRDRFSTQVTRVLGGLDHGFFSYVDS